ncbi:MAG: sigma-70 family RNA polymerase sigma factor [Candidatus Thiodiazotropha sp. 6PLUC2]
MIEAERENELWLEVSQDKDNTARLSLIDHYSYLARICANHYYRIRTDEDVEYCDYMQNAMLGLIEAVYRYDPEKGASFTTFANYRIKGALLNGLEKATHNREQTAFLRRHQRSRVESITKDLDNTGSDAFSEMVDVTIQLALSFMIEDTGLLIVENNLGDELYDGEVVETLAIHLGYLIERLPERERLIIRSHYYHGMPFEELANVLNLSKGRVSQLHKRALTLIKEGYENSEGFDTEF